MTIKAKSAIAAALLTIAATQPVLAAPAAKPVAATTPIGATWKAVHVESAWVRAAPPGSMMLAGYMVLKNQGKSPVHFVSATSDTFGSVELHRSQVVNGVSTMRPAGEQTIAPGDALRIEPGSLHLMLMQPRRELKIGDSVHFRLHFAEGGDTDVVAAVAVQAPGVAAH